VERARERALLAVEEERDLVLLVEVDLAHRVLHRAREAEGDEQPVQRPGIGRRELDEVDAEEAGGVLGVGVAHGVSHLPIQLFQ
jgi:hypothetical protein